jgi:hypothetical protein
MSSRSRRVRATALIVAPYDGIPCGRTPGTSEDAKLDRPLGVASPKATLKQRTADKTALSSKSGASTA